MCWSYPLKVIHLIFFKKMKKFAKNYSNKNLQKFEKNCFFSTSNLKDLDQKSDAKLKSEAKPNFILLLPKNRLSLPALPKLPYGIGLCYSFSIIAIALWFWPCFNGCIGSAGRTGSFLPKAWLKLERYAISMAKIRALCLKVAKSVKSSLKCSQIS